VNEKGTESAAATIFELEDRILTTSDFIADRPFLFAIVQNLKTVLFSGQFMIICDHLHHFCCYIKFLPA
ncbi:hypothetical protein WUBG_09752, partial [Wuchereria bancrofti]